MPNKLLTAEDMARLTEMASFRNTASTGAINRDFAQRIIATHKELVSWMDEATALQAALGDVLLQKDDLLQFAVTSMKEIAAARDALAEQLDARPEDGPEHHPRTEP